MITMYDSVTPSAIPADAHAVAGYVDGSWPSFPGMLARFYPHARCLSITVLGGHAAVLDVETGNPVPPSQAGVWVRAMQRAGVWRPCIYANASTMPAVRASLTGIPRSSYRLWVAQWDDVAQVPDGYDAKQYINHGPHGENYDLNVCLDSFFPVVHHPHPPPKHHHHPKKPHPKVVGSSAGAALGAGIAAILHAAGVHITPVEASAISTLTAAISGYITPSHPQP